MKFLKERVRSTTVRLPTMFVSCTTVRLSLKALLLKIYIYLFVFVAELKYMLINCNY